MYSAKDGKNRSSSCPRNEAVDATHLCEFHQVEGKLSRCSSRALFGKLITITGVIADYGLTLGGLMEFFETFFHKMGLTE